MFLFNKTIQLLFTVVLTLLVSANTHSQVRAEDIVAQENGSKDLLTHQFEGYHLNPGDSIRIVVFGETELSMDVQLNDSGTFTYPYLGELTILNKTIQEVQEIIANGLQEGYLVDPKVSVSIQTYREVYVGGEVSRPGNFPFQPGLSVGKAIFLAGGFSERAAKSRIKVTSDSNPDSKPIRVGMDYVLKPGDIVTVPRRFF